MTALEAWASRPIVIRFGCSVRFPARGFAFHAMLESNPEKFIKEWLEGATWNIWSGPLSSEVSPHDGTLLNVPIVRVRYHPNISPPPSLAPTYGTQGPTPTVGGVS